MSLELRPENTMTPKDQNLIHKITTSVQRLLGLDRENANKFEKSREIYNNDRTRRFCLVEFPKAANPLIHVGLQVLLRDGGWGELMRAEQVVVDGQSTYSIIVGSLRDDGIEGLAGQEVYYSTQTSGQKSINGWMWGFNSRNSRDPEAIQDVITKGFKWTHELPERINLEKTARAFFNQIRELDFNNPQLIEPSTEIIAGVPSIPEAI